MTAPRRPRSPNGVRLDPLPVRSFRMAESEYRAVAAKAAADDPPRTVSDVILALLDAWLNDQLAVTYLGDEVSMGYTRGAGAAQPVPVFDHPLDPFPTAPGLCGTCGEWHYRTDDTPWRQ